MERFSSGHTAEQIHHELKHSLSRGVGKRVGKIEELTAMFRNPIFTFTLATLIF